MSRMKNKVRGCRLLKCDIFWILKHMKQLIQMSMRLYISDEAGYL